MKLDDIYVELDEIKKTDWKRMTLVKSEINQLLYVKKNIMMIVMTFINK